MVFWAGLSFGEAPAQREVHTQAGPYEWIARQQAHGPFTDNPAHLGIPSFGESPMALTIR
jgi:hypothetical protein